MATAAVPSRLQRVGIGARAATAAEERVEQSLGRAVRRGKRDAGDAAEALRSLPCTEQFDALADGEIVIEAVVEDREDKLVVFPRRAQTVASPEAILAFSTASIPIVELAAATGEKAEHVLGLDFFNPVPVMSLVEIIPSLLTDPTVAARTTAFATEQLRKDPIVAPDRAGFTVNALLIPYLLAAIRMFEQGLATAEDIGMVKGCAHPMEPLELADLVGLDTVLSVSETLHSEHREQLFAPPPLLMRLVSANPLGRKSGRGLYRYPSGG